MIFQIFDNERILRLGQRYDKKNKYIDDISTNTEHYNKLRDEAKTHKAKNLGKVCQDLQLFHGKSEEIFKKVDDCRTIDLYTLWTQFTEKQKENFLKYALQWHPEDFSEMMELQFHNQFYYDELKVRKV